MSDVNNTGWKRWSFIALGGLVVLVLLQIALLTWRYYTADIRGKVGAEVKITGADRRLYNYEHFFNLCATIQGHEYTLYVHRETLSTLEGKEAERTRTVIASIAAERGRQIAQYNADAQKHYTMARFKDEQLPPQLSVHQTTQCQ